MINEYVIKVVSRCNLNCSYCYEYNLGDDSWKTEPKTMSIDTLDLLLEKIIDHSETHNIKEIYLGLHGGEPLLLGPKKFKDFLNLINFKLKDRINYKIGIQTNGTILNSDYIELIKKNNIEISVSLDGNKKANDRYRLDLKDQSSFPKVLNNIKKIQNEIPKNFTGVLAVIDLNNDPKVIYDFFRSIGINNFDLLLPDNNWTNLPFRINEKLPEYGIWMYKIFECWMEENNPNVSIRFLVSIIRNILGGSSIYESMTLEEIGLMTISTSGEYQGLDCLKSVPLQQYKTNKFVNSHKIDEAIGLNAISLRSQKINQLCLSCKECDLVKQCNGGYFPHRYGFENGFINPSVYCEDIFYLIKNIREYIHRVKN